MEKRTIKLGDYDTAANGWTLAAWEFPAPEPVENLVSIPGRAKGPLDLSTALTDGVPTYGARELTVTLESSEGDRAARLASISEMIKKLHGQRVDIVLPDHSSWYATGRVRVRQLYNDHAHACVQVTAICEPWLYRVFSSGGVTNATSTAKTVTLQNNGAMHLVPLVTVSGTNASVNLKYGTYSWTLSAGTYKLPDLVLLPGTNTVTVNGTGAIDFDYREAVLW